MHLNILGALGSYVRHDPKTLILITPLLQRAPFVQKPNISIFSLKGDSLFHSRNFRVLRSQAQES